MKKRKIALPALKALKDSALKKVKNTIMNNENIEKDKHADTIIRNHIIWSMGAGLIPVLVADIFAVCALQLDMIRQMCKIYDIDFKETQGKAIVTSLTGTTIARLGAGSIIKLIPGVGSMIGGATVSVFAGASTYALGEVFKQHFSSGGTILDFDPDRLRKYYKEKFEKGKKVAKEMNKKAKKGDVEEEVETLTFSEPTSANDSTPPPIPADEEIDTNDVLGKLKELGDLKAAGVIDDKEFEKMKKKLIDEF